MKTKAPMNRTITLTDDERYTYDIYISDHFDLNENSVICGEFTKINNQIPDKYCDLILLDPPYNLTKKYGEHTFKEMDKDDYYNYILTIFHECLRVLKDHGTMYICGDWKTSYIQRQALEEVHADEQHDDGQDGHKGYFYFFGEKLHNNAKLNA